MSKLSTRGAVSAMADSGGRSKERFFVQLAQAQLELLLVRQTLGWLPSRTKPAQQVVLQFVIDLRHRIGLGIAPWRARRGRQLPVKISEIPAYASSAEAAFARLPRQSPLRVTIGPVFQGE